MNNEKQKLVPAFRFPEFENDREWKALTIEDIANVNTGGKDTQDKINNGKYPFFVRSQTIEKINSFSFDGEAILTSGDGVGVGKIYHYIIGKFDYHQRVYCLFNFKNQVSGKFVYYYFSEHFYRRVMQLSAKNSVDSVRRAMITEMPIYLPSFSEQQKIVNCLSSLDAILKVEIEKLDHLKDHKKGLLQQLFPIEGKSKPQFRFPEFKNDRDWEVSTLNKISSSIFDGTHQTPKYTKKGIPFFSVENLISGRKNKYISREDYLYETRNNKPEFGDVLITRIGNIGTPKVVDWEYEFSIYVTLAVVKKSEKFDSYYLQAYIQSSRFQNEILRRSLLKAAPCKINMDELRKCEVLLPSNKKEQQKIANCISTADELIESQIHKIKALKKHKKGLMQQLFPNVNSLVI
ncbi:restriction endonuclease subunit S [Aquimarina mytili]|uniref:Restriction endonuclease subunit S n=1 Tax=Aquimarina mytili TaxID=874423 RepID=A0A937DC54_9FLAO|nr:restriction endonuclease subunit S [Aquimarina mytili]MBL0685288.1 restriction endonuclease subunit S [Aquimarina mytili]